MRTVRLRHALGALLCVAAIGAATPDPPVADAARRGDIEAVRALIAQGADVDAAHPDGMAPLHWAAARGDTSMTAVLLRAGARVDPTTRNGAYTPLHLAARGAHAAVVRALLEAGAAVHAPTTTGGATALHLAAGAGSADAIAALIDRGADVNAREAAWGQTPLMFAVAAGRRDAVRTLLQRGADVAATTLVVDLPARDAVDRAAAKRRDEVLEARRAEAGVAAGAWKPGPDDVQTAVRAAHEVQRAGTQAATEEFVPDPSGGEEVAGYSALVGRHGGNTALLHAVREGHADIARALLDAGADVNQVSAGDRTSPLLSSIINGHFDLALELLARGADPDLASDAGATPLFAAINTHWAPRSRYPQQHAHMLQQASYLDVMEKLLAAGADPNVRLGRHVWYMSYTFDLLDVDTRGATPFWRAAYATDVEAMRLLVAHGADPNVPTMKPVERRRRSARAQDPSGLPPVPADGPGVWPIHAASGVGYGEGYAANAHRHVPDGWLPAVKYLVEELGADVNARDHNGYNPIHHAAARGDDELILYLVEKGADVTAVSRRGQTTADMANGPVQRISPFPATVALLEKLGSKNNHDCKSC